MKHKHNHSPAASNSNAPAPVKSVSATIQTTVEIRPSPEEIATVAYTIYLDQGCPEGHAMDHWLAAESQLRARTRAHA